MKNSTLKWNRLTVGSCGEKKGNDLRYKQPEWLKTGPNQFQESLASFERLNIKYTDYSGL